MELRHLRYFLAVAEHLSFAKAAEAIHISQPPLSRQIQELEEEIGVLLFIRRNNKIELTPAGVYLKDETARILDNVDIVLGRCREVGQGLPQPIRIGATSMFVESLLPRILKTLQAKHPEIRTELRVLPTEGQEEAIRRGALDFGFVRHWAKVEGLLFEELGEDTLVLCYPRRYYSGESLEELVLILAEKPFVMIDARTSPGFIDFTSSALSRLGLRPVPEHECGDGETLLRFVQEGIGWTVSTKSYMDRAGGRGLGTMELPDKLKFGLLYTQGPLPKHFEYFIAIVRELFKGQ